MQRAQNLAGVSMVEKKPIVAVTDVYNEERGTVLVRFPAWLLMALGLGGVVAFAITGFLDYPGDPSLERSLFRQPWLLFLWFCALIIALQVSILRHPTLRAKRNAAVVATLISMALVTILYFIGIPTIESFLSKLLGSHILLRYLSNSPWTYFVINFGIIAVYVADTAVRWQRRARGLPPNPRTDIGDGRVFDPDDLPAMEELISGDLVAGAVLVGVLALFFNLAVFGTLIHTDPPVTVCTVSLPWACGARPITLTFVDTVLALLTLPVGLVILALSALLNALAGVGGVDPKRLSAREVEATVERAGPTGLRSASEEVTLTLLETLRAALDRGLRYIAQNILGSLREVGWPLLVFLGVFGAATCARFIKLYLHNDKFAAFTLQLELQGVFWGALAALAIVFSVALLVYRLRVAENSLRFLGLIGFVVLITLWIFSLALFFFELLLRLIGSRQPPYYPGDPRWHPFDLGVSTLLSFGLFVVFAVILSVRWLRNRGTTAGA